MTAPTDDDRLRVVVREVITRRLAGESLPDTLVQHSHPDLMPRLARELSKVRRVEQARLAALGGRGGAGAFPATSEGADEDVVDPDDPVNAAADDTADAAFGRPVTIEGYEILRQINRGGQAVIYLARRVDGKGGPVAIKVLRSGVLADGRQRARFEREAELLTALDHPNVVAALDRGETADGQLYLVMNYIAGEPLNPERLAERATLNERLMLFVTVCRAVDEAHRRGIVHRDLKPANVRVDHAGRPHVLDFGLATDQRADELHESMTMTGQFLGSFLWASPEQQRGSRDLTPASDVYALGVILHQLTTGGRFPPQVFDSVKRALDPKSTSIVMTQSTSGLHPHLATIIARCLENDSAARFASAGALADAIEQFLADPTAATPPEPRVATTAPRRQRLKYFSILASVIGVIVAATFARRAWRPREPHVAIVNDRPILALEPGVEMSWIPPGEFWMGTPVSESDRLMDEGRHRVRIARGFYMLRTEVPQSLYQRVVGSNPSRLRDSDQLPVESLTWREAVEFCEKYSAQRGRHIRLPTEAEWEYACRAGSEGRYCYGDDEAMMVRYGNFADRSSKAVNAGHDERFDDGHARTAPVQTGLANIWGLVNVHGNVWEWCLTPYAPYPETNDGEVTTDVVPTTLPTAEAFPAVARGGSWYDSLGSLRSGHRCAIPSTTREFTVGFRFVCEDEGGNAATR